MVFVPLVLIELHELFRHLSTRTPSWIVAQPRIVAPHEDVAGCRYVTL